MISRVTRETRRVDVRSAHDDRVEIRPSAREGVLRPMPEDGAVGGVFANRVVAVATDLLRVAGAVEVGGAAFDRHTTGVERFLSVEQRKRTEPLARDPHCAPGSRARSAVEVVLHRNFFALFRAVGVRGQRKAGAGVIHAVGGDVHAHEGVETRAPRPALRPNGSGVFRHGCRKFADEGIGLVCRRMPIGREVHAAVTVRNARPDHFFSWLFDRRRSDERGRTGCARGVYRERDEQEQPTQKNTAKTARHRGGVRDFSDDSQKKLRGTSSLPQQRRRYQRLMTEADTERQRRAAWFARGCFVDRFRGNRSVW